MKSSRIKNQVAEGSGIEVAEVAEGSRLRYLEKASISKPFSYKVAE